MSRAGIDRLVQIVDDAQSRAHSADELDAHWNFLRGAAHARGVDLFNSTPHRGLIPAGQAAPVGLGSLPDRANGETHGG